MSKCATMVYRSRMRITKHTEQKGTAMILSNGRVFIDGHFVSADVKITEEHFSQIKVDGKIEPEQNEKVIDCKNKKVIPGLFDIHTHGCLGFDFSKSECDEDEQMCKFYGSHGVTSILATTMTNELGQYRRACASIRQLIEKQKGSSVSSEATVRGINMEGPFISKEKRGAHDPQYIYPVSDELFDELDGLSGNAIKLYTIAPELDGATEFISKHKDRVASVGHSDCDYDTAMKAFDVGSNHVTHLYNAMNGLHHRKPGIIGAAADRGAYVELICDGLHVHESVIRSTFKFNPGRVIMISDSINPTGLPEGKYSAGGLDVYMKNGEIRLEDGTLAGSSITLFEGLKRAVLKFGIPEEEAVLAATYNPAASLNMEHECGSIAEGLCGDCVVIDDDYNICNIVIGGKETEV